MNIVYSTSSVCDRSLLERVLFRKLSERSWEKRSSGCQRRSITRTTSIRSWISSTTTRSLSFANLRRGSQRSSAPEIEACPSWNTSYASHPRLFNDWRARMIGLWNSVAGVSKKQILCLLNNNAVSDFSFFFFCVSKLCVEMSARLLINRNLENDLERQRNQIEKLTKELEESNARKDSVQRDLEDEIKKVKEIRNQRVAESFYFLFMWIL